MVVAPIAYYEADLTDAMGGASGTYHRGAASPSAPSTSLGAPNEGGAGALRFNGDDTFAYISHAEAFEVQNGTIALWVRPEEIDGHQVFFSKDESETDEGGHVHLGMIDGRLHVRVAPGDGHGNKAWRATEPTFETGEWTHVAVSFGADGVHIYVDGVALEADDLEPIEGGIDDPATYLEAHLLTNDKPIVLGAGTMWTADTSNPQSVLDTGVARHFNGDLDGVGVWGGVSPDAALSAAEVAALAAGEPISFTPEPAPVIDRSNDVLVGGDGADLLDGGYGDDQISGGAGIDTLIGGYGDDQLFGGDGADQLNGGRGSDLLDGGAGDDLIILGADAGEPRLGQPYDPAENPDGDLDPQTLTVLQGHPLIGDDIAIGGAGADTFVLQPELNAKRDILLRHQNADRSINWRGVAGENDEHHDHWPDGIGVDVIADFSKAEGDRIFIDGHTANIDVKGGGIEYRDVNGDGIDESIITIVSNQPNGGAHDQDLLGRVTVYGDRVERDDIDVNAGSFAGIIETVEDLDEALSPEGTPDTNPDRTESVNPFLNQVDFAALNRDETPVYQENIRPVATAAARNDDIDGSEADDVLFGDAVSVISATDPHPPISYFTFDASEAGTFADARGVQSLGYYVIDDAKALLQSDAGAIPMEDGAPGVGGRAIRFDGDDQFALVTHDGAYEVLQGTVALWFKPDDIDDGAQTLVSKDEARAGDGGHMRIEITDGGHLYLRMAPGDGGRNTEWVSTEPLAESGVWSHVAVGFGEDGLKVWFDGERLEDDAFTAVTAETPPLSAFREFFLLTNEQPWVLGADTGHTRDSTSAATIAGEDALRAEFTGAIDGFGVWGGMSAEDALNDAQVASLVSNGPGDLTAPAWTAAPVPVGDDDIRGFDGDDVIDAGAGRDVVDGGDGDDVIDGGYGADRLMGGAGDDIIDGGHGQDVIIGGAGDDLLISRSDAREGTVRVDPFRDEGDPYTELSPTNGQVYASQPTPGDDVLTGGAGADTFRFETLINAKERFLLDHVMPNGRIHWHGVAGENDNIHDHWVDRLGDETITDYNRDEGDVIEIVGHTTEILEVEYVDTDGDGVAEHTLIHVYSQQGNGGGAHDEDRLGTITVHGDLVREEEIVTDAAPAYGIVESVYDLAEAVTPLYASDEVARAGFRDEAADSQAPASPPAFGFSPRMIGAGADDVLMGDGGDNRIAGLDGDDEVRGGGGRDVINGGAGDDSLFGDADDDVLAGGRGNDRLEGGAGDDFGFGGDGDDTFLGGRGNDGFFGGAGSDLIVGGDGDDGLSGRRGDDEIMGGAGDDSLIGGLGANRLDGGAGDDSFAVKYGDNTLVYSDADFGDDLVFGFRSGSDRFEIASSVVSSLDEVSIESIGATRTKVSFGDGTVTLIGVAVDDVSTDDFLIV